MSNQTLEQKILAVKEFGLPFPEVPNIIKNNLNPSFQLRPYQIESFSRFIFYINNPQIKQKPTQLLFHMATGSGKMNTPRENSITYDDFTEKKIVLLSDEAHHINI